MTSILAVIAHVLACVLDVEHCARLVDTNNGLRCAEMRPRSSCPSSTEPAGWHIVFDGIPVCSRACGADS